jgi:fatty acid desaturase
MPPFNEILAVGAIFAIQLAGAASIIHTRLNERSRSSGSAQKWFFILLLAVGLTTMIGIQTGHSTWLSGAGTLGLMAIGATVDLRAERRRPAF